MAKIGGGGGMALSARFPVEADLSPFQRQVEEAVQVALVKFGVVTAKVNSDHETAVKKAEAMSDASLAKKSKEWVWTTKTLEEKMETAKTRATVSFKMVMRSLVSEINQTWGMISQMFGLGKNIIFQTIATTITVVSSLISTASLAATTWAGVPVIGPAIAALMVGNAVFAAGFQIQQLGIQASIGNSLDQVGNMISGVSF